MSDLYNATFLLLVLTIVICDCPRDVSTKAHSCFTAYSFHFQNMQNSPQKLCCGVDVEILRAFCQSYTTAMSCVNQLRLDCPEDTYHTIDKTLNNLNGVRAELHELCSDDSIFENYAMYQSCLRKAGGKSERCLQIHFNGSSNTNIKFLSKVTVKGMDQFCKDLTNTMECVRENVEMVCGEEAAQLVPVLIKPMIRQSTDCDYSVIKDQQKTTNRPLRGRHAFISDDQEGRSSSGRGNNRVSSGSGDPGRMAATWFMTAFTSLLIWSITS